MQSICSVETDKIVRKQSQSLCLSHRSFLRGKMEEDHVLFEALIFCTKNVA